MWLGPARPFPEHGAREEGLASTPAWKTPCDLSGSLEDLRPTPASRNSSPIMLSLFP